MGVGLRSVRNTSCQLEPKLIRRKMVGAEVPNLATRAEPLNNSRGRH